MTTDTLQKNRRERKGEGRKMERESKRKLEMKGGKKINSVEPPPSPPASAVNGGGGECVEADGRNPSPFPPPPLEAPATEDQLRPLKSFFVKGASSTAVEENAGAAATEAQTVAEEEEEEEGGKGNEQSEELLIENAEAEDEAEDEAEGEDEGKEEGETERPKLAEGYYEIEAVRKKRVRKSQVQYLIKWRGWPETANTWEPLENLLSVSDVIDAFEESLQSGKKSTRRRKRKYGSSHTQTKKKQQQHSPAAATYDVPAVRVRIMDEPVPFPSLNDISNLDHGATSVGGMTEMETSKQLNENGVRSLDSKTYEMKETNELDLKLIELKGTIVTNQDVVGNIHAHSQEVRSVENGNVTNGVTNGDGAEAVQFVHCTGAKRRKSGSVRRFKQENPPSMADGFQGIVATWDLTGKHGTQKPDFICSDMSSKNKVDNSKICAVTEIIRPISYSSSVINNVQDVSVTFMAKRSDGKEVIVDNKFLKANNALLLINFYEQHLRYNSS